MVCFVEVVLTKEKQIVATMSRNITCMLPMKELNLNPRRFIVFPLCVGGYGDIWKIYILCSHHVFTLINESSLHLKIQNWNKTQTNKFRIRNWW